MNDEMPWVNLTQEEVIDLRNKKFELTQYGKEKLRKLMNDNPTIDEMIEEAARRERSNRILERYNNFYNLECSGLSHGTAITPEFQQAMTLECMLDTLRCENLNREYNEIAIDDIKDLIAGLYRQSDEFLERVRKLKEQNNG